MNASGEGTAPVRGKVQKVRQDWLVHEDEVLATRLQDQEFGRKYNWNRQDRQVARQDVPLARIVSTEEERRAQRERLEFLQAQRAVSEEDEQLAQEIHEQEQSAINTLARRADDDAAEARRVHEEQMERINQAYEDQVRRAAEDAVIASQFQREEVLTDLEERRMLADQELARKLQEQEKKKYVLKMRERELKKRRKALESELAMKSAEVLGKESSGQEVPLDDDAVEGSRDVTNGMGNLRLGPDVDGRRVREDGKLEDLGDFSDFYIQPCDAMDTDEIRELQEIQDEELARIIQDQEFKRGAQVNRDRLREMEARDAELAKVMQQQEKVKLKKHMQHRKERQMSLPNNSQPPTHLPHRAGSVPTHTQPQHREVRQHSSPRHRSESSPSRSLSQSSEGYPPASSHALYQSRPLPDTPPSEEPHHPEWETSLERALNNKDVLPASPAPPGYRDPPSYPSHADQSPRHYASNMEQSSRRNNSLTDQSPRHYASNMEQSSRRNNSLTDQSPRHAPQTATQSGNVFAAIDPTAGSNVSNTPTQTPTHSQASPPLRTPPTVARGVSSEDSYCDLDDMAPVQGMKRTSKRSGKGESQKKGNCKQQ